MNIRPDLTCPASSEDYFRHSSTRPGVDRKVVCPSCGKAVVLRAAQPGFPRYIPRHNRAAQAAAKGASDE